MSDKVEKIIEALRKKVLDSAIRGELVPQNPDEEPASALLKRIAAERERLIKEKKIKKPKNTSHIFRRDGHFYESLNGGEPACLDDDLPFEIPDSWEWVRGMSILRDVENIRPTSDFLYIDIEAIDNKRHIVSSPKTLRLTEAPSRARRKVSSGDVLFSLVRPYLENIAYISDEYKNAIASTGFFVVRSDREISKLYIFFLFLSSYVIHGLNAYMRGDNSPSIKRDNIYNFFLPIPPLQEQHRIAQKVEEILSCLEECRSAHERYMSILSKSPGNLREQLIQAAIQGQLVPQDENDEPASVLLERIAKERAAKLGKKAVKSMSRIERRGRETYEIFPDGSEKDISKEIPFKIPDSWEWCRLDNLVVIYTGKKDANFGSPDGVYPFFTCAKEPIKCESFSYDCEAILLAGNGDISNITYYKGKFEAYQRTYILENALDVNMHYLNYHLLANWVEYNQGQMFGSAIPYIRLGNLQNYLVSIPPLQEQHRISERLDALLKLVEVTK